MKNMRISIVTATWNSAATVGDTLRSVVAQVLPEGVEVEHVVVDGASADATAAVVEGMRGEYERRGMALRWVSEPDKGIYDAMNKGVRLATGDVVGILNSDDFYSDEGVLAAVARELAQGKADAVYGDIHYVRGEDLKRCVRYYSSRYFRRWMMVMGYQPAHPSFYCRRECYERYGAFDISLRIAADFENLLRLIYKHRIKTRYIPMDFVTMREGGASTDGLGSHMRILREHYRAYRKNGVYAGYCLDVLRYPLKLIEVAVSRAFPDALKR